MYVTSTPCPICIYWIKQFLAYNPISTPFLFVHMKHIQSILTFIQEKRVLKQTWGDEAFHTVCPSQNITNSEWFETLYTFTTTCWKIILMISGSTPSRKPHYGISKFSIFLVYSSLPNKVTLDKIRIFSSSIWNFSYFLTF